MAQAHRRLTRAALLAVGIATLCFFAGGAIAADTARPELLLPLGHSSIVSSVALSADGRRALTGKKNGTAILWDAESGKPLQTLKGHSNHVTSVALSADGRRVLTGEK